MSLKLGFGTVPTVECNSRRCNFPTLHSATSVLRPLKRLWAN